MFSGVTTAASIGTLRALAARIAALVHGVGALQVCAVWFGLGQLRTAQ